jgi:hypothetical protein
VYRTLTEQQSSPKISRIRSRFEYHICYCTSNSRRYNGTRSFTDWRRINHGVLSAGLGSPFGPGFMRDPDGETNSNATTK